MRGGEGKSMSLYGKSILTPEEKAGLLKNVLKRTTRITKNHLTERGDGSRHFPGAKLWTREELEERKKEVGGTLGKRVRPTVADARSTFERLFDHTGGYDCKMHRDDGQSVFKIGCAMHDEEDQRKIPLLTSSNYGHRLNTILEPFSRSHVRVEHVQKGFYFKRGTGLPPIHDCFATFKTSH